MSQDVRRDRFSTSIPVYYTIPSQANEYDSRESTASKLYHVILISCDEDYPAQK